LPPSPTVPSDLPSLNVEQYAWLSATLRKSRPDTIEATLTRLRLTQTSRAALEAIWTAHMARYPEVKQAFLRAFIAQM